MGTCICVDGFRQFEAVAKQKKKNSCSWCLVSCNSGPWPLNTYHWGRTHEWGSDRYYWFKWKDPSDKLIVESDVGNEEAQTLLKKVCRCLAGDSAPICSKQPRRY